MATFSFTFATPTEVSTDRPSNQIERQKDKLFGKDVKWGNGNTELNSAGDYITVNELAELRASVYRRMITRPGAYTFVPDYGVGLEDYVKTSRNTTTVNALRLAIEQQLLQDERITNATVAVATTDDGLKVNTSVKAKGNTVHFTPIEVTT